MNKPQILEEVLNRFAEHQTDFPNWKEWKVYSDSIDDRPHPFKYTDRIIWLVNEVIKVMNDE